jgi:hypothetical protein
MQLLSDLIMIHFATREVEMLYTPATMRIEVVNFVAVAARLLHCLVTAPVASDSRPRQEWKQTSQIKKHKGCLLCNAKRKRINF